VLANLWWILFGLGTAVFLAVMAGLIFALFRQRREMRSERETEPRARTVVLWGGLIIPAAILVAAFAFNLGALRATALPVNSQDLVIEIIGRRWWWEVHYPGSQFRTANEIYIPVGQPVQLQLASEEVIHSFWVPQLHGKMDAIPGRVNTFWIQADEAGQFLGECAEFCGVQHANMRLLVVALPPEEFAAWLENQSQPAPAPADEITQRGQEVFLSAGCINCHTIRGTQATGELGPDLTHLASRFTLASATVANNRGHLGGWIADPHSIKPGNLMPPTALSGEELQALLAYLESLE